MTFSRFFARLFGTANPSTAKPVPTASKTTSSAPAIETKTDDQPVIDTSKLRVTIPTTPRPVQLSDSDSDELTRQKKDMLANLKRITSSPYYNGIGDVSSVLIARNKAEDKQPLTPSEQRSLEALDLNQSPSCVSPLHMGKSFEFVKLTTPTKLAVQRAKESNSPVASNPLHFSVKFKSKAAGKTQESLSANFVVTNDPGHVVVESEKDFEKAQLFQAWYPKEAAQFGFAKVLWFDSASKELKDVAEMAPAADNSSSPQPPRR
jgi:hypothetical protein